MREKQKVCIYGGTFNPPHIAHVRACEAFYNEIKPDLLLVIPDFLPPHKEVPGGASTEERLEMTRLAFEAVPAACVSDMEIKRGGRSYTAITLSELYSPEKELYFLCGTDMFLTLDSWYKPETIFSLATICYVRRENDRENEKKIADLTDYYIKRYNAKIISVAVDVTELSSSELREKIKFGEDVTKLLPEKVNNYIQKRGIYK